MCWPCRRCASARRADARRRRSRAVAGIIVEGLLSRAAELADRLIGGITYDELPFTSESLGAQVRALAGFVLRRLLSHLLRADASARIYDGVSINAMAMAARRRESVHYEATIRSSPTSPRLLT